MFDNTSAKGLLIHYRKTDEWMYFSICEFVNAGCSGEEVHSEYQ